MSAQRSTNKRAGRPSKTPATSTVKTMSACWPSFSVFMTISQLQAGVFSRARATRPTDPATRRAAYWFLPKLDGVAQQAHLSVVYEGPPWHTSADMHTAAARVCRLLCREAVIALSRCAVLYNRLGSGLPAARQGAARPCIAVMSRRFLGPVPPTSFHNHYRSRPEVAGKCLEKATEQNSGYPRRECPLSGPRTWRGDATRSCPVSRNGTAFCPVSWSRS
jgi:hypothetical protein